MSTTEKASLSRLEAAWQKAEAKQTGGFPEFEEDNNFLVRIGKACMAEAKSGLWYARIPFVALTGCNEGKQEAKPYFLERVDKETGETYCDETQLSFLKSDLARLERDVPDAISELPSVLASLEGTGAEVTCKNNVYNGKTTMRFYINEVADVEGLADPSTEFDPDKIEEEDTNETSPEEEGEVIDVDDMNRDELVQFARANKIRLPRGYKDETKVTDDDIRDLIDEKLYGDA